MNVENAIRQSYDRVFGGEQNMGALERAVSTGLGLIMAAGGLRRGADLPGTIMGLTGAAMVARGMSGHCPVKAMMEGNQHRLSDIGAGDHGDSRIGQDHTARMHESAGMRSHP